MNFLTDWKQATSREKRSWTIQTSAIIIIGSLGVTFAITFANSSPRNYCLVLPAFFSILAMALIGRFPWRDNK